MHQPLPNQPVPVTRIYPHKNIILGVFQLFFWLFCRPTNWRIFVAGLNPPLRPEFSLWELLPRHWRDRRIRRMLLQGYVLFPVMLLVGLWLTTTLFVSALQIILLEPSSLQDVLQSLYVFIVSDLQNNFEFLLISASIMAVLGFSLGFAFSLIFYASFFVTTLSLLASLAILIAVLMLLPLELQETFKLAFSLKNVSSMWYLIFIALMLVMTPRIVPKFQRRPTIIRFLKGFGLGSACLLGLVLLAIAYVIFLVLPLGLFSIATFFDLIPGLNRELAKWIIDIAEALFAIVPILFSYWALDWFACKRAGRDRCNPHIVGIMTYITLLCAVLTYGFCTFWPESVWTPWLMFLDEWLLTELIIGLVFSACYTLAERIGGITTGVWTLFGLSTIVLFGQASWTGKAFGLLLFPFFFTTVYSVLRLMDRCWPKTKMRMRSR